MKTSFSLLGLLTLLPFSSFGQAEPDRRFTNWDRNKDGKLTKEELPQPLQRNFERVDKNKDGSISLEEHLAVAGRPSNPRPNRGDGGGDGFTKLSDLDYAGNENPKQKLDLYLPKNGGDGPLPVVCWIHGGGWKGGDKRNASKITRLVSSGTYAGVSIGYRLSHEAQWPSQIHDCKAAIRWIRANAEEHNLDPNRIAVWGSSAGGHLVAMLGVSHQVDGLEGEIGPHTDQSSEVTCVVDYYGPTELLTMNDHPSKIDHNAANSPESLLIGGAIQENQDQANNASPISHVSADDEPILIVHGTKDELVPYPQSVDFEKKLEEVGVSATFVTVTDGGHGGGFGPTIQKLVEQFLAKQLLGKGDPVEDQAVPAGQ
ncbi:MAG: alpha/beta hydrolase fold domain-containing protein [Verrucomicrobiota bacterium]